MFRRLAASLFVALCLVFVMAQASAQEAGTQAAGIGASILTASGDTRAMVSAEYGIMTSEQIELGGRIGWIGSRRDYASRIVLGGYMRYKATVENNAVPYFTAGFGFVPSRRGEQSFLALHGGAGVEGRVGERTGVFAEIQAWKGMRSGMKTMFLGTVGVKFYIQ